MALRIQAADILNVRRRWLHLPVEVKARAFQSRLLLACVAAERGYGTVVGTKSRLADLAKVLPTGIYLEKSCQLPVDGYEARHAMGHALCCLDEEGVVYVDADDYAASRLSASTLSLFERFFAWGDDQAEVVAAYHPPTADRIRVTGNPRVDLWRPELRTIYEADAEALRREHGSFVLLPTAFAMVNNGKGADYHLEAVGLNGMLDTDEGVQRAHGYLDHCNAIFEAMCKAVVRVAEAVPDRAVIIRPHPSESADAWEQAAAAAGNVSVIREGPVTPWLLAADVIVHSNCTTGLEGFLMGRPTIAFAPRQDVRYDQNVPNKVSQIAVDEDELIDLVRANLAGTPPRAASAGLELVRHHIAALDGDLAADRLVAELDGVDVPALPLTIPLPLRAEREVRLLPLRGRRAARDVARRLRRRPDHGTDRPTPASKFPGSTIEEVEELIGRFHAATGRFGDLACAELGSDVYAIVADDHRG